VRVLGHVNELRALERLGRTLDLETLCAEQLLRARMDVLEQDNADLGFGIRGFQSISHRGTEDAERNR
jgi:heme oxygenase